MGPDVTLTHPPDIFTAVVEAVAEESNTSAVVRARRESDRREVCLVAMNRPTPAAGLYFDREYWPPGPGDVIEVVVVTAVTLKARPPQ